MAVALPEPLKKLLDEPSFATVATLMPDGSPHLSVVWVKREGDTIVFSTVEGRRKQRNLARDPRVSVLINPPDAPYTYGEVRGTATMTTEGGKELINELSRKYTGKDYTNDGPDDVRVCVRITPEKVVARF